MPITHCCLVSKSDKTLLAEYPEGRSNWMRVFNLLTKIQNGGYKDHFTIEDNQTVSYVRTKHVIFICISVNISSESIQNFLENLIKTMKSQYKRLEELVTNVTMAKHCQQTNLYPTLCLLVNQYNKENTLED